MLAPKNRKLYTAPDSKSDQNQFKTCPKLVTLFAVMYPLYTGYVLRLRTKQPSFHHIIQSVYLLKNIANSRHNRVNTIYVKV